MASGERTTKLAESPAYTPLSGLAVAALTVSAGAAVLLATVWAGARYAGKPAHYPMLLLPPLVGLLLAIAARRRIVQSQGALTGGRLAAAAWWIAILCGGSYAAYFVSTELAIRNQAEQFTREWFGKIASAPPESSFLYSLDATQRQSIKENDIEGIKKRFGVNLHPYRTGEIVRFLQRAGDKYELNFHGLKNWELADGGYNVVQLVDVRTPEGKFGFEVPVRGRDVPELGGRVWFGMFPKIYLAERSTTELGRLAIDLQFDGRRALNKWADSLYFGKLDDAYRGTLPPAERTKNPDLKNSPEFKKFLEGAIVKVDGVPLTDEQKRRYLGDLFRPGSLNVSPGSPTLPGGPPELIILPDGRVKFRHLVEIRSEQPNVDPVVAYITMELLDKDLEEELRKLQSADWKSLPILPPGSEMGLQSIDRFPNRAYRIDEIDIRPSAPPLTTAPRQGP